MKNAFFNDSLNRRELLGRAAFAGMALALPASVLAQSGLATEALRDGIYRVTGAGTNVIVAVGPESVIVVDGGLPEHSAALLAEIDRLSGGKPVAALFNSNWRPEHCGLNRALGARGVTIIAHENTRLWQSNDFYVNWEDRHHAPVPAAEQANATFYKTGSLRLGSETIAYGTISNGHTDGDLYVHFLNANILFAGDTVTVSAYPVLDYVTGGWIVGAQENTDGLLAMADTETLVIPAVGPAQGRAILERQADMLAHAYEAVATAYKTGRSLAQFRAAMPMAPFNGVYGDPTLFEELLYRGTWYHVPGRAIPGII